MEEKQALLYKEQGNSRKNYQRNGEDSAGSSLEGSDEWWDDSHSSCSSCCDSGSDSSFEWEAEIKENGQLFYITSDNIGVPEAVSCEYQKSQVQTEEKAEKLENVKKGRLVSWMRRRDIKKLQLKLKDDTGVNFQPESEPQFQENSAIIKAKAVEDWTALREVSVKIDSICEGSTLCEKLLGLTLNSTNETNLTITNINPNGPSKNCKDLSLGDILHSINNFTVTPQNLNSILGTLNFPTEATLKIQKNDYSNEKLKNVKYQSNFVKSLLEKNEALETILLEQPVGVVVVDMESQNLNKDDVIYDFPKRSVLSSCRGAFVTLFHLLAEINPNDICQSSSVILKKKPTHILYRSENNLLLLIAIPKQKCTIKEATYIVDDVMRNFVFNHQTLKRCFEESEKSDLDRFFSIFFSRILCNGFSSNICHFGSLESVSSLSQEVGSPLFEDILPHVVWVPLPKEAQIQMDDALNELEANDIDHEENEVLESQRLFNIIGSCVFHKGYLLISHLQKEDLLDVYSFYRQNCLIQLFRNEPVRSLIIWKEVFPQSVNRGIALKKPSSYPIPSGRWFLLIIGQGYDSLAVILEAGSYCAEVNENTGPAIAYVEEAKDTLRHMQKLGIFNLASQWIANNSRFKTITPEEVFARKSNKKKENLLGFVKSFDGNSKPSGTKVLIGLNVSPGSSKSSETYPSKRTRGFQQDTSEDSVSQTTSNVSEVSDENAPILGRRAERGKTYAEHASDSDSSDSDWDSSKDSNMRESTCSSGLDNFYLRDMDEVIPAKLTTGPDYLLFSYFNLDGNEGVLLHPPMNSKRSSPKMLEVLENFRRCSQIIHCVLENNIKFKKSHQDSSKSFINKSLIAVKEHGVLFECSSPEYDSHKKPLSFTYWIIGRLFFTPQPREVYVCYYDDAPQNLVEIAFRLGLSVAG